MNDKAQPFSFSQFVPGFDFLANLAKLGTGTGDAQANGLGGMPGLSNWVAPTLSVEEVDKRIKELKTVQFWLEQNLHALKATVQALEVQKMTLSTLQGMNLRMDDLAKAFGQAGAAAAPEAAPAAPKAAPVPKPETAPSSESAPKKAGGDADAPSDGAGSTGLVDPVQWWGALSQQFQQIANTALQEAANLKMPGATSPAGGDGTSSPAGKSAAKSAARSANGEAPAARKAGAKRAPAKKPATRRRNPPNAGR